jgi:hypothetical protein
MTTEFFRSARRETARRRDSMVRGASDFRQPSEPFGTEIRSVKPRPHSRVHRSFTVTKPGTAPSIKMGLSNS